MTRRPGRAAPAGRAMAAQPRAGTPSLVARSSSAGMGTISVPAPLSAVVWFWPGSSSPAICRRCPLVRSVHDDMVACLGGQGRRSRLGRVISPSRDASQASAAGWIRMWFPRCRAEKAARSPVGLAAGTPPDDQAAWPGPNDLDDRACCCCPARPVVRVLIPPASARPHSVDLLLCGHHHRRPAPPWPPHAR